MNKVKAKKNIEILVLEVLCISVVMVAVYSILTYGRICISSDTATASLLAKSQIKHKSWFPETWNYGNGEVWMLRTNIPVLIMMLFTKDQSLVRTGASVLFVFITVISIIFHSEKNLKEKSWVLSVPLFLVFLFGSEDMILYQAAYTDQMLWITLCSTLLYEIYAGYGKKERNVYLYIYETLMILLLMGGIRMMAEETIPMLITCFAMLYMCVKRGREENWKLAGRKGIYMSCVILIPSGIGYGIYKWLCSWHNVNNTDSNAIVFVDSLSSALNSLWTTLCHFYSCFGFIGNAELKSIDGFRNMISILACTVVCFIVPFLQARKIEDEPEAVRFFYIFGMIHNFIMIILSVFFGKSAASRYILSTVFVSIIVSSRYVFKYWIKSYNLDRFLWTGIFTVCALIESAGIVDNSAEWRSKLHTLKEFNGELLSHGLTKGYATYWNAYSNEIYSDFEIRFGGIDLMEDGIEPHLWLVDSDVYVEEDTNTFLLLTSEENEWYNAIGQYCFEKPIEDFMINGMYVYVFDYDII